MTNFGATFRKARETAGFPLEKIAAETRISTRFLLAIENETFDLLPGGIFNRGFIRSYAEHLGLDPEQAVADYIRMTATAQEPLDALRNAEPPSRRSDRNLYPIAAAILIISIVAYYFVTRKPAPAPGPETAQSTTQQVTEAPPEVPTTPPPPEAAAKSETEAAVVPQPAVAAPAAPPAPAPPPTPTPSALALDVNVKNETWIKVTADGTVVFADVLQAGADRRFSAEHSLNITLGNAGGASLKINGRDMGQLGTNGQVREFRITPENAAQIRG